MKRVPVVPFPNELKRSRKPDAAGPMELIRRRQATGLVCERFEKAPKIVQQRVNADYDSVYAMVDLLRKAALPNNLNVREATDAMRSLTRLLVEGPGFETAVVNKRMERLRDAFIMVDGPGVLVQLFQPPFAPKDLMSTPDSRLRSLEDVWNDAIVTLREICYTHPDVSEPFCRKHLMLFFFSLMGRKALFDAAASIVEELLAVNPCLFRLDDVPRLDDIISSFSCRQLAIFCRVLALLIYDPEDRQMLESAKVVKSHALLQLRRDRVSRTSAIVEANQATLLRLSKFLDRLVKVLHIVNFAPSMDHLTHFQHINQSVPRVQDLLFLLSNLVDAQDWAYWEAMLTTADPSSASDDRSGASYTLRQLRRDYSSLGSLALLLEPMLQTAAERANGQNRGVDTSAQAATGPVNNGFDYMTELAEVHLRVVEAADMVPPQRIARVFGRGELNPHQAINIQRQSAAQSGVEDAHNALRLHGLLLVPYQVEVFFVLCTMLQGRRKADVQAQVLRSGGAKMLTKMFDRLAWDRPEDAANGNTRSTMSNQGSPSEDASVVPDADETILQPAQQRGDTAGEGGAPNEPQPQPHGIHGPGCECDPESALRVQFLRLVHAFCDRDSEDIAAKWTVLSATEAMAVREFDQMSDTDESTVRVDRSRPEGLVMKIAKVLQEQKPGSIYKFWLSSCVEAFLRGSTPGMQQLVATSGVLDYLVREVLSIEPHGAGALQTAFDLLAELSKGSTRVISLLDGILCDSDFDKLTKIIMDNFIDSNVFLRAILCTMERHNEACTQKSKGRVSTQEGSKSYFLKTAWKAQLAWTVAFSQDECAVVPVDAKLGQRRAQSRVFEVENPIKVPAPRDFGTPESEPWWLVPRHLGRFATFVSDSYAVLFRDLATIIDVLDINHENICCLNTALALVVVARRRGALEHLLDATRCLKPPEDTGRKSIGSSSEEMDEVNSMDAPPEYALFCPVSSTPESDDVAQVYEANDMDASVSDSDTEGRDRESESGASEKALCSTGRGDRRRNSRRRRLARYANPLKNFRELLWFWRQYYDHRGRDRLTLEFSSQIAFGEWDAAVRALSADDGGRESLLSMPTLFPPSPFDFRPNPPNFCSIAEMEGEFDESSMDWTDRPI